MRLVISETIGARCIVAEDGQRLHDAVVGHLRDNEDVFLDFSEVRQFASPFFNFSIGQLLNDVSEVNLRKFLHLEGLNETGRIVVERVIANASKYQNNEDYRKIVDDILEQQAKGED
jgi:hypothetical protein